MSDTQIFEQSYNRRIQGPALAPKPVDQDYENSKHIREQAMRARRKHSRRAVPMDRFSYSDASLPKYRGRLVLAHGCNGEERN